MCRLTAIDSHDIAQLRDSARTLSGGIPSRRDRAAVFLLESPEQLNAMGLAPAPERATYSFRLSNGRTVTRQLDGAPPEGTGVALSQEQWLYPAVMPPGDAKWQAVLDSAKAPWSWSALR